MHSSLTWRSRGCDCSPSRATPFNPCKRDGLSCGEKTNHSKRALGHIANVHAFTTQRSVLCPVNLTMYRVRLSHCSRGWMSLDVHIYKGRCSQGVFFIPRHWLNFSMSIAQIWEVKRVACYAEAVASVASMIATPLI